MVNFKLMSTTEIPNWQSVIMYSFIIVAGLLIFLLNVRDYGIRKAKYGILVIVGTLSTLYYLDIGHKYTEEWRSNRADQKELNLQRSTAEYYKNILDPIYSFKEYHWFSNKQTLYTFTKNGDVNEKDMDYILKVVKPLDRLDISIEIYSLTTSNELVMRFTNEKDLIGCTEPLYRNLGKTTYARIIKSIVGRRRYG